MMTKCKMLTIEGKAKRISRRSEETEEATFGYSFCNIDAKGSTVFTTDTFSYSQAYKNILRESLIHNFDTIDKNNKDAPGILFNDHCRTLYHEILEYNDIIKHTYVTDLMSEYPLHDIGINNTEYLQNRYISSGNGQRGVECINNVKYIKAEALDMFNTAFAANNCNNGNGVRRPCSGNRNLARLEKHKNYIDKLFCNVVVYGYMAEKVKLTKLKNVTSYVDVINSARITINKSNTGDIVRSVFTDMLENLDLDSLKHTGIGAEWNSSDECFEFMTKIIFNQITSEKLLLSLQSIKVSPMSSQEQTDTTKRINEQHNEIKSSKDYLLKVFLQFICLKKRELKKLEAITG